MLAIIALLLVFLFCLIKFASRYFFILLGVIFSQFIKIYIKHCKKFDKNRINEYFGIPSKQRPDGKLIWVYAASIGEGISALPLINMLCDQNIKVLLTTNTLSSWKTLQNKLPDGVIHQFAPIDVFSWIKKFVQYWQPSALFLIESEIWPNMINYLYQNNIKIYLLNMRISEKTTKNFYRIKKIFGILPYKAFSAVFAPSKKNISYAIDFGAKNVNFAPNLKLLSEKLSYTNSITQKILSEKPAWIAVSIKPEEEEIVLKIHKKLHKKDNKIITVVAPRHLNRIKHIINLCKIYKIEYCLYSKLTEENNIKEVIIIDQFGVLGELFASIITVFVGGSMLKSCNGHNAIEPIKFGCNVVSGQYIHNFQDIYNNLKQYWNIVTSETELANFIENTIYNKERKNIKQNFDNFLHIWQTVISQILKNIL